MPKRKKEDGAKEKVKYKGVIKRGIGRFQAYIYIDGKMQNIGMFEIPKKAARAYDRAAIQAGRPTTKLNFQDKVPIDYKPKRKKLLSTNTIGYRGVCKNGTKFKAQIQIGDNYRFIGNFGTTKEAAIAWDLAAIQAKRPISELNFPDINKLDTSTSTKTKEKKKVSIKKKRKTTKTTLSTTTKSSSSSSSSCSLDTLANLVSAVPRRRRMTNL